jgi:hypothetical protein
LASLLLDQFGELSVREHLTKRAHSKAKDGNRGTQVEGVLESLGCTHFVVT